MIEVQRVSKSYRGRAVLNGVSLQVNAGELLVLAGSSGVGKSTLLRLIAGLEQPDDGRIVISGKEQERVAPHERDLAMVFQSGNGYDHLRVRENLSLAASLNRKTKALLLSDVATSFGIDSLMDQKFSELSGGQVQRVAIARSVLTGRSIILMDEPLAHLDETNRDSLRQLIRTGQRLYRKTILYVTHDSEEALSIADRIAVMHGGSVAQIGHAQEVYEKPATPQIAHQFGRSPMSILKLPSQWFDGNSTTLEDNKDLKMLCGIRSHWWQFDSPIQSHKSTACVLANDPIKSRIELTGKVVSSTWLGDRLQIELEVPTEYSERPIQVSAPYDRNTEWSDGSKIRCWIEKSRVHRFDSTLR